MRLSAHSDYALRLLIYAGVQNERLVTLAEVAAAYKISKNHLMKIANKLVQAGVLTSVRGRGGGLRLAKPAGQIRIGEVVRLTEERAAFVECCDASANSCVISGACKLKCILLQGFEDFFRRLDRHTLAEVLENSQKLQALLSIKR